jgi:hypothetical protein
MSEGMRFVGLTVPELEARIEQERREGELPEPPCRRLPREKWCDRNGPGGFMGHTCCPSAVVGAVSENRVGDWIQTYSGAAFWPLDPWHNEVLIEDIAHALSMQCRYTGHTREFYSVAQHSVLVSTICDAQDAAWGLLHDASEAYLCDVSRPVKVQPELEPYRAAEQKVQAVIMERFGIEGAEPQSVKRADRAMLWIEYRDQMLGRAYGVAWQKWATFAAGVHVDVRGAWQPKRAENEFLYRFHFLADKGLLHV